ncbi:hypothetical protein C4D60_Mb09t02090 [Musa balbisiana]|uniref:Uncharacterized protein n=1 Tax=Musa balbisiana TaxID=52838 RepID=A0A4V4H2X9_MUSBA|nr:hypothetical protein C4D60_Mb09t02090 [Musa balbisiana]
MYPIASLAWRCMYTEIKFDDCDASLSTTRAKFLPKDDQLQLVVVSEHTGTGYGTEYSCTGTLEQGLAPSVLDNLGESSCCTRQLLPRSSSFFSFPCQPQQYPGIRDDGDKD